MASLTLRIEAIAAITFAVLLLAMGWTSYAYVARRCDRLLDAELRIQADAVRNVVDSAPRLTAPSNGEAHANLDGRKRRDESESGYQYWDGSNRLQAASSNLRSLALDALPVGYADMSVDGQRWHVLSVLDEGRWIRVAQRTGVRDAIRFSLALQVVLTLGAGLPLVMLLIGRAVARSLSPIHLLAEQISRHVPGRGDPISPGGLPREFESIVASVNKLLARCGTTQRTEA